MRFVLLSLIILWIAAEAYAQNSDKYQGYVSLKTDAAEEQPRLMRGRQTQNLAPDATLEHTLFAQRMGQISAMIGDGTTLYIADKMRGQIFKIDDRDGDGNSDGPRPLPQRFDSPSALAMVDGTLYVADRNAVWQLSPAASPIKIAGLKNANSTGEHFLHPGENSLWLGLNTQDGVTKILKLSLPDGQATLVEDMPARLIDMSGAAGSRPWLLSQDKDGKKYIGPSSEYVTDIGYDGNAFFIPAQDTPNNWPPALSQHIFLSRPIAGDIIALPTTIQRPIPVGKAVLSGFTAKSGRSSWGIPGAIYQDTRGLFIADAVNGDIWLLRPKTQQPIIDNEIKTENISQPRKANANPPPPKTLPIKSGIGKASHIEKGSQISRGSLIERASNLEPATKSDEAEDNRHRSQSTTDD